MPDLTRRPDPHRADCWLIYFGDVHVGTVARAVGTLNATEEWRWQCGFYPGCNAGEHRVGSAPSFDRARSDFERAWRTFSARRTEADYQAWRDPARLDGTEVRHAGPARRGPAAMKYERPYSDPETAARKILEIANSVEAIQDARIHVEKINGPFLFQNGGSPAEYGAGIKLAIERA
jgi:hypothetical protein